MPGLPHLRIRLLVVCLFSPGFTALIAWLLLPNLFGLSFTSLSPFQLPITVCSGLPGFGDVSVIEDTMLLCFAGFISLQINWILVFFFRLFEYRVVSLVWLNSFKLGNSQLPAFISE